MNIASAVFDRSAPDLESCPAGTLPEFAFIGRSNVGKSSLLNMLAGKRDLARVSATPGFTKMINFFTVNRRWRLVDLPGYGFAQVAREHKAKFNQAVAEYLAERESLRLVLVLIDSALPPQELDLDFVEWLVDSAVPFVLVFTKTDTLKPEEARANVDAFLGRLAEWCDGVPEVFLCSSVTRTGRTELLRLIGELVAQDEGQEAGAGGTGGKRRKGGRAKGPSAARPW